MVWESRKGTVFMRVAALALVLIIASAVVLIFANTLNSWVLGGLIGGLAALLISIPISLIMFATLARRQDERLYEQMLLQQEEDLAYYQQEDQQKYDEDDGYYEYDEYGRVYEAEAYYLPAEEDEYERARGRRPQEVRSLPAAGQSYASSSARATAKQRALSNTQNAAPMQTSRKPTRELAPDRERNERSREAVTSRQTQQTGHQHTARVPYTTRSLRSQQQAAARRVAQQEAAQGSQGSEQMSTDPIRRPATTRHLPPQSIQLNRSRLQEEIGKKSAGDKRQSVSDSHRGAKRPSKAGDVPSTETQTDQLRGRSTYPTTGPIRLNPETGQVTRKPQLDEQYSGGEAITGNLRNPLVRRAPYLYEDDPLREEFSQQIDKPITRRASRYLSVDEDH
jgi:hypothetical protein